MDLSKEIDELLDLEMDEIPMNPRKSSTQKSRSTNGFSTMPIGGADYSQRDEPVTNAASKSRKKRREKQNTSAETLPDSGTALIRSSKLPQESKSKRTKPARLSVNSWDEDDLDKMYNTFVDKPVDKSMDIKEENEEGSGENVRKSKSAARARRREEANGVGLDSTQGDARQRRRKSKHRAQDEIDNVDTPALLATDEPRPRKKKGKKKREVLADDIDMNTNPLNNTLSESLDPSSISSIKRQNRRKKKYGDEADGLNITMNGETELNATVGKSRRKKGSSKHEDLSQDAPDERKQKKILNPRKQSIMYGDDDSESDPNAGSDVNSAKTKRGKTPEESNSEDQLDERNAVRRRSSRHRSVSRDEAEDRNERRDKKGKRRKEPQTVTIFSKPKETPDIVDEELMFQEKETKKKSRPKKEAEMSLDELDGDDFIDEILDYEQPKRPVKPVKHQDVLETDDLDDDIDQLLNNSNFGKKSVPVEEENSNRKRDSRKPPVERYKKAKGAKKNGRLNHAYDDEEEEDEPKFNPARRPSKQAFLASESEENESESDNPEITFEPAQDRSNKKSPSHHSHNSHPSSRNTTDTDEHASPAHSAKSRSGARGMERGNDRQRPPTGHGNRLPPSGKPGISAAHLHPDSENDRPTPSASPNNHLFPPRPQSSAGNPSVHRRPSVASNAPSTRRSSAGSFYVPQIIQGAPRATGNITSIFTIGGHSYDVTLTPERISWSSVIGSKKVPKAQRASKKSFFSKRRRSSLKNLRASLDDDDANSIDMEDILGAAIKRSKHRKMEMGFGVCEGIGLYLYEKKAANKLRDFIMVLEHPEEAVCAQWVHRIQEILREFPNRPRKIKTFLNPYAGRKNARGVHMENVARLFMAAGIEEEIIEVTHNEKVKQELVHTDLCDYDSLVVLGGDGTVNKVINGLLNRTQWEFEIDPKPGFIPSKGVIPVGIIPCGTTNQIVHSVQGIDDISTAVIHIILGNHQEVDVCSVYHEDQFYQWALNCHYGFFGGALRYMHDFAMFGSKKIEASIAKALKKNKYIAYEVDLQYIPDTSTRQTAKRGAPCRKGCNVCSGEDHDPAQYQRYDHVKSLHHQDSSDNSDIADESEPSMWRSIKGEYMNVSLFSTPAFSQHAPLGMSKLSHLADGAVDLAVVRKIDRMEFVRFLRRHGKSMHKNQFDMPFVEVFRCKEVRCSIRYKETWNHVDHNYSEIDYQVKQGEVKSQKDEMRRSKSERVISDLDTLDSDEQDEDSDDLDSDGEIKKEDNEKKSGGFTITKADPANPTPRRNPTLAELEAEQRRKKQIRREEKAKWKAERGNRSLWNLDNEICTHLDLHFRVHKGLLTIYGDGIDPAIQPEEPNMGCLSML